jgi:acyl carrier protein
LKEFPLTPNGKVDSRRLPAPDGTTLSARPIVAPSTPAEEHIAGIWREVLSLKQISVDENFFEAGGDSLSATRAFARINEHFGSGLTLREIFEHPTIRDLAKVVSSSASVPAEKRGPIRRQPRLIA